MHDDDRESGPPPEVQVVSTNEALTKAAGDGPNVLVPAGQPPALLDPETLVLGLRHLRQRIPGFVQLSLDEQRAMTRAAYLDPEFIAAGIHAAGATTAYENLLGLTAEELREEDELTRRCDHAIREVEALLKGMADANLQRKHRVGQAILLLYAALGRAMRHPSAEIALLRPYYEEMQRAYKKSVKKKPKKKAQDEETQPAKE
jgi:hypothetical protein